MNQHSKCECHDCTQSRINPLALGQMHGAKLGELQAKLSLKESQLALAKEALQYYATYYATYNIGGTKTCHKCKSVTILNTGDEGAKAREALEKLK